MKGGEEEWKERQTRKDRRDWVEGQRRGMGG